MGKRASNSATGGAAERPPKVSKRANEPPESTGANTVDDEGNVYWELSGKRRAVVQCYRGAWFVNLREYYSGESGGVKPGKKGIMLSVDQYTALLTALPAINKELASHGVDLRGTDAGAAAPDGEANEDDSSGRAPATSSSKPSKAAKSKKANIEATSDEDEEDKD